MAVKRGFCQTAQYPFGIKGGLEKKLCSLKPFFLGRQFRLAPLGLQAGLQLAWVFYPSYVQQAQPEFDFVLLHALQHQ
jgi:hypothetical protein